ncbi:MAG: UDP-N-acetylglucosamine 2-epimerase (non-hydrolyzing) [Planctomycetota bacterium]
MITCGARPNFMKAAALVRAFAATGRIRHALIHTGQHYDANMSTGFFRDLNLPEPDFNLGVGSGSHAFQTAEIMARFEPVLLENRPDWLFVVGDVNSTIACALVASKLGVKIAHVEAGLRSFDRSMPEEINRVLTDRLSDLLFVTEPAGMTNLRREGIAPEKCHLVGDTMADTLLEHLPRARQTGIHKRLSVEAGEYALLTLHRPGNVDDAAKLSDILDGLAFVAEAMPIVFPAHPRTVTRLDAFGLRARADSIANLRIIEPLGYLDFLKLMADARLVVTDSGGIQEETTILGVTCMTLRETTERPYTVEIGTNRLVKPAAASIRSAFTEILAGPPRAAERNALTDGHAGRRIAQAILSGIA